MSDHAWGVVTLLLVCYGPLMIAVVDEILRFKRSRRQK